MHRRLFWKVYATLIASLIVAALAFGLVGRITAPESDRPWRSLEARFLQAAIPLEDTTPGEIDRAVARLAKGLGGELELLSASGQRLAASGAPVSASTTRANPANLRTIALNDGRIVRVRMTEPNGFRGAPVFLATIVGVIGLAAWPVVAQLTRRLERLRAGVELWGAGALSTRVPTHGNDEIAAVAAAFNDAAEHVERLWASHRVLLANASHELRSPLARLRMAIELNATTLPPDAVREVVLNLGELDDLVGELLLSSRLDHDPTDLRRESIDLLGIVAEEAARVGANVVGVPLVASGDARLLQRLLRNLLDNANRHGAPPIDIDLSQAGRDTAVITVRDHGKGIPDSDRDRVFQPFYRPLERSQASGSWGLGLALVRQIAARHGGTATYAPIENGAGFVVTLPILDR